MSAVLTDLIGDAISRQEARSELRGWALLALGSLGIAGVFALLLAVSRVPGVERFIPVMIGFFPKGLVIHVVFSFVVWLLAVFALIVSTVTHQIGNGQRPALGWAGAAGQAMTMLSFPLLFLPSFIVGTQGFLNNYVPVIGHPMYMLGVAFLYGGILLPVLRLFANLRDAPKPLGSLPFAMACGGFIYIMAMITLIISAINLSGREADYTYYNDLFWGSGHILSFLNTLLVLAGWQVLGKLALGQEFTDPRMFRMPMLLLAGTTIPAAIVEFAMRNSPKLAFVFTDLQYGLMPPVLLVAIGGVATLVSYGSRNKLRLGTNLPLLCVLLSMAVFITGGVLGFAVNGTDTRTPAHYHGLIAGVNLALMGWFLFVVPTLIGKTPPKRAIKAQLLMFGLGQLLACVGLFWAGGYGAPRKIAGQAQGLIPIAKIGMYLNGIGALVAVIGGIIFVWTALRCVASSSRS